MAKQKRVSEAQPKYAIDNSVKFSWCSGFDYEIDHNGCKIEFHSDLTNKLYKCSCQCHKDVND